MFYIFKSLLALILLLLCMGMANAFPPAPGVVVYGTVRNELGWSAADGEAVLVFSSGERELRRVTLTPGVGTNIGENYRTLLPLDMEDGDDAYRASVLATQLPFSVQVEIGDRTFLPMETFVGLTAPSEPASQIRLDFTLGEDSDADGLPDAWEYWQLESSGMAANDPNYNLNQLNADGDADGDGVSNRDEYNAGTFAFVFTDKFALLPKRVLSDGWLELTFEGVVDKSYLFECSNDMDAWEPITVGVWGDRENRQAAYRPSRTGDVDVLVPPPTEHSKFFRVTVN